MSERYKKSGLDALISMNGKKNSKPLQAESIKDVKDPGQFFTTRIPKTLIKELKILSAQVEKPIQSIVMEAIQEKIKTLKHV